MTGILELYAKQFGVSFINRLGEGKDGEVYQTSDQTAVKFLNNLDYYDRELRAYRILEEQRTISIAGFNCPQYVRDNDVYLSIEMTIVRPPFIVDFVSAYTVYSLYLISTRGVLPGPVVCRRAREFGWGIW